MKPTTRQILILICTWQLSAIRVWEGEELTRECTSGMVSFNWIFGKIEYFQFAEVVKKMIIFLTKIYRVLFTKLVHSFMIRMLQYLGWNHFENKVCKTWRCGSCIIFWMCFIFTFWLSYLKNFFFIYLLTPKNCKPRHIPPKINSSR